MKFSDISNLKLSPGRYIITASFDGDNEYNGAEAQLLITVNEEGEIDYDVRPVEDEDAPPIVMKEPSIEFSQTTLDIIEKDLEEWPFNWYQYLKNSEELSYNIYTSDGLVIEDSEHVSWVDSGTHTLTLTTLATEYYLPKTITLTLNVTAKTNPQIEYTNENNEFALQNGVLTKRYYNIEKREGVYMFDLIQPTNPFSLPLRYVIDETQHGSIDTDDNKVYISKEGKYKITAIFDGDDIYRTSITSYILKYYEGEEPADDEEPEQKKMNPNLSFAASQVKLVKSEDNRYEGVKLINPYGVTNGIWIVSQGNISIDGSVITYDGTGNIIVTYIFKGDENYYAQTVNYVMNIYVENNEEEKPIPDISFDKDKITVTENEQHEYQIQFATNNSGVNINYYYNDELIENGILKTNDIGTLTIKAVSDENNAFSSCTIYYNLVINAYVKENPELSFDQNSVTEYQTDNFQYLVQFVNNPHDLELVWSCNKGDISDGILYFNELGTIVITVKNKPNFYYNEGSASYTLTIEETPKLSPELSFNEQAQFFNRNDTNKYDVQPVNNPHNVEVRWFCSKGELNSEVNPTLLTITGYSGAVDIYCKSVEDDTYKSETVTYKLYVGATKKYLQYTKHANYTINKTSGDVDVELLRYAKSNNLEFDPTEWRITSSLQLYCKINSKYYIEDGDDIVVMSNMTINRECNPVITINFLGNDEFYNSGAIHVTISFVKSILLSPEISFPNSYVNMDQSTTYEYVLQDVNNPHDVEIVYSASTGVITGNVLYYEGMNNVIISATSIETDVYASQTITYKLNIKPIDKPSSGIHFPLSVVNTVKNADGVYELQGIVDAEDNPISYDSLPGEYNCSVIGDIEYNEDLECYTLTKQNWYGVVYVTFIIRETATYKKETITYTLNILSDEKASPNLAFANYQVNMTQNSEGKYAIQPLINPNNVPVTWFCSKGEFDDPNNPQYLLIDTREYVQIGVQSTETEDYKAQRQAYGLTIMLPSKKKTGLRFENVTQYMEQTDNGKYPIQALQNPNNLSPLTWTCSSGRLEDGYLVKSGIGESTISVIYDGDDIYDNDKVYYTQYITGQHLGYLDLEGCESVELIDELNKDFEVRLVKWQSSKGYVFNQADWRITSSNYRCKFKSMRTEEVNGYVYLIGTFTCVANVNSNIVTSFKGNDDFYNDEGHSLWIEYEEPVVVDNRIRPDISFSKYMQYLNKTDNCLYPIQELNKPDDVEIDRYELNYGGNDFATAKIIDDTYIYYEGTDYVHLKVYTKESDKYKSTSDGYSLYINVVEKWEATLSFVLDNIGCYKNDEHIYQPQSLNNPNNVSVTWYSNKGTIDPQTGVLSYNDVGEVIITVVHEEDETYARTERSYKLIIRNEYQKRDLNATRFGDQSLSPIEYNQEYNVPLIKWPLTENLKYTPAEWSFNNDNQTKCICNGLFTVDEGDYRILKGKFIFTSNGYTYYTLKLVDNAHYYANSWSASIYFEKPAVQLIDPKISWSESKVEIENSENNKYEIQTPQSEYNDVEFYEPYSDDSGVVITKENGVYYATFSGHNQIDIAIKNKSNNKYYERIIYYTIKIVLPETKPNPVFRFMFGSISKKRSVDNTYQPQTLDNPNNLPVHWESDMGVIDTQTGVLTYDTGGQHTTIRIRAIFDGNEDYNPATASYILLIADSFQKRYLESSNYGDQEIEVIFNSEYDIPLIKWPISENLEYVQSQWTLTNTNSSRCVVQELFTVDEGDYRILKAKCIFTTSSYSFFTLRLINNDFFYDDKWELELYFSRQPDVELIDPQISWPDPNPEEVPYNSNHLYLIQTPQSVYQDVEFNAPYSSKGEVIKDGNDYYLHVNNENDVVIYVKSKADAKYYSSIISYHLRIANEIIQQVDPEISFANEVETVEYIWESGMTKRYKVQPLINPNNVGVVFYSNKGELKKLENTKYYYDNEGNITYIDYGYYLEYDNKGDVIITARTQNSTYYYSESVEYIMRIAQAGQSITMKWPQSNYYIQIQNARGLYQIPDVEVTPDEQEIRNNIEYRSNVAGSSIVYIDGTRYLSYNGLGYVTVTAKFKGNGTYAPYEVSRIFDIRENTKSEAPFEFPESSIYVTKNNYNIYQLQLPVSTDGNNYNYISYLQWTLPDGWHKNNDLTISSDNPFDEDVDLLIQCYLPESQQFKDKLMSYTLHISSQMVALNAIVHDDYDEEIETGIAKLEILKWPVGQNYIYNASDWEFTRQYTSSDEVITDDISSYIVCEELDGYYVLYYREYIAPIMFDKTYTITANFNGGESFRAEQFGLYMKFTEKIVPIEKRNPEIEFKWYKTSVDDTQSPPLVISERIFIKEFRKYEEIGVEETFSELLRNPNNVPVKFYYQEAVPRVDDPTFEPQGTWDLITTGEKQLITDSDRTQFNFTYSGIGYFVITAESEETTYYYSDSIDIAIKILERYPLPVDPDISLVSTYIETQRKSYYTPPGVINNSNVSYYWVLEYVDRNGNVQTQTDVNAQINQYGTFSPDNWRERKEFLLKLITYPTEPSVSGSFNSITLTCRYVTYVESKFKQLERYINDGGFIYQQKIYDEINASEQSYDMSYIYPNSRPNFKRCNLIEWNSSDYTFNASDWEIEITNVTGYPNNEFKISNEYGESTFVSLEMADYNLYQSLQDVENTVGLPKEDIVYTELLTKSSGSKRYICPLIGIKRTPQIDKLTSYENIIRDVPSPITYHVQFKYTIKFKGKYDNNLQDYVEGLEPKTWDILIDLTYSKQSEKKYTFVKMYGRDMIDLGNGRYSDYVKDTLMYKRLDDNNPRWQQSNIYVISLIGSYNYT